jgi:hypothetical protein
MAGRSSRAGRGILEAKKNSNKRDNKKARAGGSKIGKEDALCQTRNI